MRVFVKAGYQTGWTENGKKRFSFYGEASEYAPGYYEVQFKGYYTTVDFSEREIIKLAPGQRVYRLSVTRHGPSAKSKGIIGSSVDGEIFLARSADGCYEQANKYFSPDDRRPLAGKSYIKEVK